MKKIILALAASVAAMGAAQAQGPYVGLGIVNADTELHMPGAVSVTGGGWKASGKLFGGYEFDDTFGVEAGYTDFRGGDFNYLIATVPGRIETDGRAFYLAGKATAPLTEQFAMYGKLGMSATKFSQSGFGSGTSLFREESHTEGYLAVGAEYKVSPKVGIALEYERYGKTKSFGPKPNVWTLAARYSF